MNKKNKGYLTYGSLISLKLQNCKNVYMASEGFITTNIFA